LSQAKLRPIVYPEARKTEQTDDYHGTAVPDPYRWLEDLDSTETQVWSEAQNRITFDYLTAIPERESIKRRLTQLWNYERYGVPFKEGGRYFYLKNDGLQNQSVLYVVDSLDAEPKVLLDPNALSEDGTVALSMLAVSPDGHRLAYGLSASGSDWQRIKIRDVDAGEDLEETLQWIKFSGASWTPDNQGFYYSRYDEPKDENQLAAVNYYQKLYYHKVGAPQSEDVLVYERPDRKEWGFHGHVTDDGDYLIISISLGTDVKNRVYYRSLREENAPIVPLLDDFDAAYHFIGNDGPVFYFYANLDAPRYRLLAIDIRTPERENWREILPEAKETLDGVSFVGDRFIARYLKDAATQIRIFDLNGRPLRTVDLPGIGTAYGFGGKREDQETFYLFSGFAVPGIVCRYDLESGESEVFRKSDVDFDPAEYVTEQVFYDGKDGAKIPMFLTYKKGLERDGDRPTLLYGYGGFNISVLPGFDVGRLVWMERGGILAVANLRGGGEYGEEWHQSGMKAKKQNVFDDFIAAAEWLIEHRYTSTSRLAIQGGSNGGLLVGACLNQRPDLFGAAVPQVGVMDMLRFPQFTIGWAWTTEYGSPDDPDDFETLFAYSPYHNVRPGVSYPPTLITTADHDDRVWPGHSFKYAAALQEAQGGDAPILIRIESKAGHGAGKPISKIIEQIADVHAFLIRALDAENG
jgi:prolyl oligopeptidase